MAVILVLGFGILGFGSAITSITLFDANLLQALGIWSATGLSGVLLALTAALLPRRRTAQASYAKTVDLQNS